MFSLDLRYAKVARTQEGTSKMLRKALFGLLVVASTVTQAAEPTGTLTLACKGTQISKGGAGTPESEQINIGIIVDFQKKTVAGLSDTLLKISGVTETAVSFDGAETGWSINGTLDRVTGSFVAASISYEPNTRKTILSVLHDLQCRPTQRMF
jgi:hypothetical protein